MTTALNIQRDPSGYPTFGLMTSDSMLRGTLLAGVVQNITVPANIDTVLYTFAGGDVWVDNFNTATVAPGAFNVTTAELNPVLRSTTPGSTISMISEANALAHVSFYFLGTNLRSR